jgi:hypothetical protein
MLCMLSPSSMIFEGVMGQVRVSRSRETECLHLSPRRETRMRKHLPSTVAPLRDFQHSCGANACPSGDGLILFSDNS